MPVAPPQVYRPTDLCFALCQTENGVATLIEPPHAVSLFICKSTKSGPRVARVGELTNINVEAHSGEPVRYREVPLNHSINPGVYVVVVATYMKDEESPFELKLHSNYDVNIQPIIGDGAWSRFLCCVFRE